MVMPLGDDDSRLRTFPAVTLALVALNLGAYVVVFVQPDIETFLQRWAVLPIEYSSTSDLPPTHGGPFWVTLFTAMFLHGGIAHVFGNLLFLWIFGDNVEEAMGRARFLAFYLVCGVAASLAHIAVNPASRLPSVGASGAISGVLGAYLILYPRQRVRVLVGCFLTTLPAVVVIGLWIFVQFVNGFGQLGQTHEIGGVAYAAHIGGVVAGLVLVWPLAKRSARRRG